MIRPKARVTWLPISSIGCRTPATTTIGNKYPSKITSLESLCPSSIPAPGTTSFWADRSGITWALKLGEEARKRGLASAC